MNKGTEWKSTKSRFGNCYYSETMETENNPMLIKKWPSQDKIFRK